MLTQGLNYWPQCFAENLIRASVESELENSSLTPMTFPVNAEEFSAVQMHQNEVKAVLDIDR